MSTTVNYTKGGIKVQCDVSLYPAPRPQAAYPIPHFPNADSSLLSLTLFAVANQAASGIQVAPSGTLPGGPSAVWTLFHQAYQGTPSPLPTPDALALTVVNGAFVALQFPNAMNGATHNFWLMSVDGTKTTVFPLSEITTPADPTQVNISTSNLVKNAGSDNINPPIGSYEGAGLSQFNADPTAAPAFSGSGWGRMIGAPVGGNVYLPITPIIPVQPGDQIILTGLGAISTGTGNASLLLQLTGPGGVYNNIRTNLASSGSLTAPTSLTVAPTVTSGYVGLQLLLALESASVGAQAWFNRFYLERVQSSVNRMNSVDWLTNSDKIILINAWNQELQIKGASGTPGSLDWQAIQAGVSASAYDAAVSALSTGIISSGAPSDWATRWPDGTSWNNIGIMTALAGWWGAIAATRTALQNAISQVGITNSGTNTTIIAQQNSASYLTNLDKITLMAQWSSELATQARLDAQASAASVSSTAYDNAVLNLSTQLISAGAPSNWATLWPDGTTSGPWVNIMMSLAALWATIATQRANLVNGIKAAGDAAAQSAAISAAATDATAKALASTLASQLHVVAWASSALPSLPNGAYPAGYLAQTTDYRKFQVNTAGTAWGEILQGAVGIFGQLVAGQLTVANFDNLVPNPGCQITSPPAGSYEASGLTYVGAGLGAPFAPTGYCRALSIVGAGYNYAGMTPLIPANPGDIFTATCKAVTGSGTSGNISILFQFLDASGADINNVRSPYLINNGSTQNLNVTYAAPAGTVYVQLQLALEATTASNTAWFNQFYMRRCVDASVMVDGSLTAKQANVNMAMTSNFATDTGQTAASLTGTTGVPSGNPMAGAWMGVGSAQPILVGPGGMKVGIPQYGGTYSSLNVDAAAVMGYQAIRTNYTAASPPAVSRFWYGGNCDPGNAGGAPNIGRLTVTPTVWDTTNHIVWLDLAVAPSAANDNLDGMQFATIQFYKQSAAGTTGTLTAVGPTFKVSMTDRLYNVAGSDGNAGNIAAVTASANHASINGGVPAAIITLYNSFGPSATHCFYAGSGWTPGTPLIDNSTAFPSGLTGGGSGTTGGGGGAFGCVPAGTLLTLANGGSIPIEWAVPGLVVAAWDEATLQPTPATIQRTYAFADRALWRIQVLGHELVCSHDHRLWNGAAWVPARDLVPGQETLIRLVDGSLLCAPILAAAPTGEAATVFHVGLDRGHIFSAGAFLAHNIKPLS